MALTGTGDHVIQVMGRRIAGSQRPGMRRRAPAHWCGDGSTRASCGDGRPRSVAPNPTSAGPGPRRRVSERCTANASPGSAARQAITMAARLARRRTPPEGTGDRRCASPGWPGRQERLWWARKHRGHLSFLAPAVRAPLLRLRRDSPPLRPISDMCARSLLTVSPPFRPASRASAELNS